MTKCVACGKSALLSSSLENNIICNTCASKVNLSSWKKRNFETYEELVTQKNNAVQLATSNGFLDTGIRTIEDYFDAYINAGYITSIDGKAGQTLKVFTDYCIIETKNETKKTELTNMFYQLVDEDDDDEDQSFLSSDKAGTIAKGLISGRLIETGVGIAASAYFDSKEKEKANERKVKERHKKSDRLVTVGEYKVNLCDIAHIDTHSAPNIANGYLRFVPKGISPKDYYSCVYFFFNNSRPFETKKIKQRINLIRETLSDRISEMTRNFEMITATAAHEAKLSVEKTGEINRKRDVFEEIRKYKELFDEGIITEEEFNIKKKLLLKL